MQRKVFRVEQMAAPGARRRQPRNAARGHARPRRRSQALVRELARLREAIAGNARELGALLSEGKERRMTRAAGELGAAVEGMEKATDKILKAAETIDDSAKSLGAALKNDYERGLAAGHPGSPPRSTRPAISRTSPASASAR